jgi:hypothetical protein
LATLKKTKPKNVVLPHSGLSRVQTIDAISQAWLDSQSLQTYRHAPNTGSRKSWTAGDACSRTVNLAYVNQLWDCCRYSGPDTNDPLEAQLPEMFHHDGTS